MRPGEPAPTVWLGNAYQNAGTAYSITTNVNGAGQPALQFQPDVTRQPVPAGTPPTPALGPTARTVALDARSGAAVPVVTRLQPF